MKIDYYIIHIGKTNAPHFRKELDTYGGLMGNPLTGPNERMIFVVQMNDDTKIIMKLKYPDITFQSVEINIGKAG